MSKTTNHAVEIVPGYWISPKRRCAWRPDQRDRHATHPQACKPESWHLLRWPADSTGAAPEIRVRFVAEDHTTHEQFVRLRRLDGAADGGTWLGWVQAPIAASHVQLVQCDSQWPAARFALHRVAERDPKCHPLANLPPPTQYKTPFPIERIVLPESLAELEPLLAGQEVRILRRPKSLRDLAAHAIGAACVLDPAWVDDLKLTLHDVERIVPITWLVIDLETLARLVTRAKAVAAHTVVRRSPLGVMSARVEYADVPTRGFALMDTFPYGVHVPGEGFAMRVLDATRIWRKYSAASGFAPMLLSQTPDEKRCNDVLSAMRAIGQGELIATDLPWIVAGEMGPPAAPRLARHALRMHLGCPLREPVQYWNRWDDTRVVVRDIADLARRYPPLVATRWRNAAEGVVALGISLRCALQSEGGGIARRFVIRTGRIDSVDPHDGVPPEPLIIFMRQLADEWSKRTAWARKHLSGAAVTWQFDTAAGLRYAALFGADESHAAPQAVRVLRVRASEQVEEVGRIVHRGDADELEVPADSGLFGDRSLDIQRDLSHEIRRWIAEA
ncbi:MAG: hypothetical protein HZB38_10005 [Planctomycetes bacterium]|nr:hypothetical protein [Planctomycetota bacterium]